MHPFLSRVAGNTLLPRRQGAHPSVCLLQCPSIYFPFRGYLCLLSAFLCLSSTVRSFCMSLMRRVGQNRIYTKYMTVYLVISLPKIPYKHRIYMVVANPTHALSVWMSVVYTKPKFPGRRALSLRCCPYFHPAHSSISPLKPPNACRSCHFIDHCCRQEKNCSKACRPRHFIDHCCRQKTCCSKACRPYHFIEHCCRQEKNCSNACRPRHFIEHCCMLK